MLTFAGVLGVALLAPAPGGEPADQKEQQAGESSDINRIWRLRAPVADDVTSREGVEGPIYICGDSFTESKLPVGYPRPTPPGAIEIKHYPAIRQAEYSGEGDGRNASRAGFMPLFRHIQSNNIAMTAPVEMRYSDTDSDGLTDRWTMAFLYHVPENGPTGSDGSVEVVDTEPVTVLALGVVGGSDFTQLNSKGEELGAWLDASEEWERAGDPRVLAYNGPYVPTDRRWWEVQIPVRPIAEAPPEPIQETP